MHRAHLARRTWRAGSQIRPHRLARDAVRDLPVDLGQVAGVGREEVPLGLGGDVAEQHVVHVLAEADRVDQHVRRLGRLDRLPHLVRGHQHQQLAAVMARGLDGDDVLMVNNYVLLETMALVQHRLGIAAARTFHDDICPQLEIDWIGAAAHGAAATALLVAGRRQLSLVDLHVLRQRPARSHWPPRGQSTPAVQDPRRPIMARPSGGWRYRRPAPDCCGPPNRRGRRRANGRSPGQVRGHTAGRGIEAPIMLHGTP